MRTDEELMAHLKTLHDAVLLSVDLKWADGTVTLDMRTATGPEQIVVRGVTRLVCPREYPWGRSVSVNEIRLEVARAAARFQIEIEMQSGDVLVVCGSAIVVGETAVSS